MCGTAIESPMKVLVRINLIKNIKINSPQFETFESSSKHIDNEGYFVTTGIGPDIMEGAQNSVRNMIELLSKKFNIPDSKAYMFCSVCADLRISEIVDVLVVGRHGSIPQNKAIKVHLLARSST